MKRSGILFVLSAPSGAGKTTLCDNIRRSKDFIYSISCTTRAPRRGEEQGKDYDFIQPAEFQQRVERGYFLEHATVHGNRYGTPLQAVKEALAGGSDILLDIDVQGAEQIRSNGDELIRASLVDVFLMPPTFEELEKRLRKRATDDEATIERRLAAARGEMKHWREYRYVILSASMEEDLNKFRAVISAERYRTGRLTLDEF
ncbi:MAG: guanylate kinase [Verrucomicrobiae bacterium]|nr:guanylate kinase [Verrucomicrobiae bacterium]